VGGRAEKTDSGGGISARGGGRLFASNSAPSALPWGLHTVTRHSWPRTRPWPYSSQRLWLQWPEARHFCSGSLVKGIYGIPRLL
jgi:hypothetical protein